MKTPKFQKRNKNLEYTKDTPKLCQNKKLGSLVQKDFNQFKIWLCCLLAVPFSQQ